MRGDCSPPEPMVLRVRRGRFGDGRSECALETITVRFVDGAEAELDARAVLPGGPNYAVRTPIGESWCGSAADSVAIDQYMTSSDELKSLAKVAVTLMPPGQRTGVGTPRNAADFYVATKRGGPAHAVAARSLLPQQSPNILSAFDQSGVLSDARREPAATFRLP